MSPQRTYEDESPVSDYRRSVADYDSERNSEHDREISLSTPTILGLFFALAIVCACFFGLGYAMGRKSLPTVAPALVGNATALGNGATKPTAGSTAPPPAATSATDSSPAAAQPAQTLTVPLAASAVPTAPAANPAAPAATNPAGSFVVQVAAVSSQDVADILLSSLQKKGYSVAVHPSPQDKLLHVQIGPFTDRAAAEAMRQRVLADGFNAIVK